jgi:hypothetical protein
MTINDRIADAITRHGPDSPSGQAHTDRGAYLLAVADRVDHRRSARPDHPYQHAKYFRPTHLLDSPLPGWPGPSVNAIIKAPNDCTPARRPEIGLVLKPKSNRTSFARRAQRRAMPAAARNKNRSQPAMTMTRTCTDDTAQPDGAVAPHRHPVPGGRSSGGTIRSIGVGAVLVLLAGTTVACGSGNTTTSSSAASSSSPTSSASKSAAATSGSTTYPAGKEQICQARDQLKTSITTLTDQGLLTAGTTAIKASVQQVQTNFDAVKAAAKEDYHSQVTDMQDALQQLQTAAGNLGNGDVTANLVAVGKAVTATAAAAEDLFTQLKTACGS